MSAASLLDEHTEHTDANIFAAMQDLIFPVAATRKRDGVRGIKFDKLASKTFHAIRNREVQEMAQILPRYFDTEIGNEEMEYNDIQSIVMSYDKPAKGILKFYLLDKIGDEGYITRINSAINECLCINTDLIVWEHPTLCNTPEELMAFFLKVEAEHAEGICFRLVNGRYKCGKSTLDQQLLVKLARFFRTELTIVGFEEQQENGNPDLYNGIGYMKRQTCADSMIGKNTFGTFICTDLKGQRVKVGSGVGLTDKLRKEIWDNRDCYYNKQITVKHKPHGQKDVLRHPIFVGFREKGY